MHFLRFCLAVVLTAFTVAYAAETGSAPSVCLPDTTPDVTIGIVYYTTPSPNEAIIPATVREIQAKLGRDHVHLRWYTLQELSAAVRSGDIDIFIASSGFYRSLMLSGVSHLATVASQDFPDPNHSDGTAFIVRADSSVKHLENAEGKVLGATSSTAFLGYQVGLGEIARRGRDPDHFFKDTVFFGGGNGAIRMLAALKERSVDIIMLRQCWLENYIQSHPAEASLFRVVDPREGDMRCKRSTDLYPTWTIGTTPDIRPEVSRLVTAAVLDMPKTPEGFYWGIATDYRSVDQLFKDLRTGPYSYLREWSLNRFLEKYWGLLMTGIVLVVGLILHGIRAEELVKSRTIRLQEALIRQKAYEQQVREANAKVSAMERMGIIGQLCSMFAHEMGQPLGAISLYAQGLKSLVRRGNTPPEQIGAAADEIEQQARRASEIVARVRAYARARNPKIEPFRLQEVIARALHTYSTSAGSSVRFLRDEQTDVQLRADPVEMEILVMNLIKNASEAAAAVWNPTVTVGVQADEEAVRLTVSDNGPEVSDEVFESLQSDRSQMSSSKHAGVGLGVQICRAIVEKNGGRMIYVRRPGGGLTVQVTFPLSKVGDVKEEKKC